MNDRQFKRRYVITVVLIGLILPALAWNARLAVENMRIKPEQWAPLSFPARERYDRFSRLFEGQDVVVVSWDGCTVDDPRLAALEEALHAPAEESRRTEHRKIFDRIVTGYRVVRELTADPLRLPREEVLSRLKGTLVGPDGKTSCLIVVLTYEGNAQRQQSIDRILETAVRVTGVPRDALYVTGPPVDGVAIDIESIHGVNVFGAVSTVISLLLCWYCVRSWAATGAIVCAGICGQLAVLGSIHLMGYSLDAVLIIIPSLLFVLTVSAGVHFAHYYDEAAAKNGTESIVGRALRRGWKPCALAAATTVVGLGSLVVSDIAPISAFGQFSAAGVVLCNLLLLLLLPGALVFWPPRKHVGKTGSVDVMPPSPSRRRRWHLGLRVFLLVHRRPRVIAAGFLLGMLLTGCGLLHLTTAVSGLSLFASDSRIIRDYRWMEKNIGPIVPVEVVLGFHTDANLTIVEKLQMVADVQRAIAALPGLSGTMSAVTFAPELPSGTGPAAMLRHRLVNQRLNVLQQSFRDAHYLSHDGDRELWRISARVSALEHRDYGETLADLERRLAPILAEHRETYAGLSAEYTGILPLVDTVQNAILRDLSRSFLTAFVLVALAVGLAQRSVTGGVIAMLPNVFPAIVVFGSMGWLGIPVDIGSVMTASVALGIAVDDTLHFLAWYRGEVARGATVDSAVRSSIRHCGRAMVQTTCICGLGLVVFTTSDFVPTQRFAWMMVTLLTTALLGDLVLLPALLCSLSKRAALRVSRQGN